MAESKPRVLLVEDTRSLAVVYEQYLAQDGYEVVLADCGQQALAQLLTSPPPVVLLDLELPDMSGMDILQQITEQQLPCSVVVITAHGSVDVAVEAMRLGAFDFLTKPVNIERLEVLIQRALKTRTLEVEVRQLHERLDEKFNRGADNQSFLVESVIRPPRQAPGKSLKGVGGDFTSSKDLSPLALASARPFHSRQPCQRQ